LRLVADAIRKLSPEAALMQLTHMPKYAAKPLADVLASAIANAKAKNAKTETLQFKRIEIMGGPATKRWNPVSRGQAHAYKKRMTHVCIVLVDQEKKE